MTSSFILLSTLFLQHGCDKKSFGIDVAKLAGVPSRVETRAREILKNLEQNDNILADNSEDDKLLKGKQTKAIKNSSDSVTSAAGVEVEEFSRHVQVETDLTKALLLLNPESITPRQALEIIYDLHAKAQKKSF